jgi:hypothetical protein
MIIHFLKSDGNENHQSHVRHHSSRTADSLDVHSSPMTILLSSALDYDHVDIQASQLHFKLCQDDIEEHQLTTSPSSNRDALVCSGPKKRYKAEKEAMHMIKAHDVATSASNAGFRPRP